MNVGEPNRRGRTLPGCAQLRGSILIEVLVAFLIFSVGLLGLAALLAVSQQSEMEAYQRSYALMLLDDMANRVRANVTANRGTMVCYDLELPLGSRATFSATGCDAIADGDLAAWDAALKGSAEQEDIDGDGSEENVGAMIGARGCVTRVAGQPVIQVAVAWQGLSETSAPTASDCAGNVYGNDAQRRVVARNVRFANAID
jgi:type IV pilus assembly protein PilV